MLNIEAPKLLKGKKQQRTFLNKGLSTSPTCLPGLAGLRDTIQYTPPARNFFYI